MRKIILLGLIGLVCGRTLSQNLYDSTHYYAFNINYWFNLHHYLWLESFMNAYEDSTIITQELPLATQRNLDRALTYYKSNLTDLDLRTSDYMIDFKHWITMQSKELSHIPQRFETHIELLKQVDADYQTHLWPLHKNACQKVIDENIELIRATEEKFVNRITKLTRQFWQAKKLNVDVTYVAKATKWNLRNRPYTSLFPTHVIMNAIGENKVKENWIELLYHESAHHLILGDTYFVGGTINDLVEVLEVKAPRELGHAFLFYFTGELTKQLLQELNISYEDTYMERNGVFARYYPFLDKHLQDYMNRDVTLIEATKQIIMALN